ncbi:pyrroline-5-carboxylate reductase [Bacillus sp. RO2]|jgi:pyrroline-5-carboxylate reductase|uniref:pyrroline-5-carboxylate reductase n=1 Tax=Bacillus sp. RO2 TaxID=2723913 RepID=UPI00145ED2AB|nr:pyrroline-5-carboxylate reductase [Bacillus sp. RO2]NMH74626.1 pyrroline-5-carboxylate reductase [Bacillus sp. RO2]
MLKEKVIGFIGAGSMAEAMISGIVASEIIPATNVVVSNRSNIDRLIELENKYGVRGVMKQDLNMSELDIIVLAMKPKDIEIALASLKDQLNSSQLLLSVLAGVSTGYMEEGLNPGQPVIRVMPNTSSMIGESATAISAGKHVGMDHMVDTKVILETIGKVYTIEEEQMDVFTGVAGSGPAYFYYLMEHMEKTAKAAGLDEEVTRDVVAQTILGAAKMMQTNNEEPSSLRKKVTSPNGTTAAGLEALSDNGGGKAISAAIKGAAERSKEISAEKEKELILQ